MTTLAPQVADPTAQIVRIAKDHNLPAANSEALLAAFGPFFGQAAAIIEQSRSIVVTDATQLTEMANAGESRKALKKLRVAAEKVRVEMGEGYLRTKQAIDKCNKVVLLLIEPEENRLEEQEQFAARAEAARKEALCKARTLELAPFIYPNDVGAYRLGEMSQDQYDQLLDGSKHTHQKRIDDAARAEADRKAEAERLAAENTRLRAEREEADRLAKLDRELAEAEAREAAEAAETERQRLQAIADKAEAERAAAQKVIDDQRAESARVEREALAERKRAESAPDRDKLAALAVAISEIKLPAVESIEAIGAVAAIRADLSRVVDRIMQHADRIGK